MWCCAGDGGRPSGTVLQGEVLRGARSVLELDGDQEVVLAGLELYEAHARLDVIFEPALNRRGSADLKEAGEALAKLREARSAFVASCREQINR
jgi:hypothetical protein